MLASAVVLYSLTRPGQIEALSATVTLHLRMVSLRTAVAAVSEQIKFKVRVRDGLPNCQVNVFVQDQAASKVLACIAALVDAKVTPWTDGDVELAPEEGSAMDLANLVALEETRSRQIIRARLDALERVIYGDGGTTKAGSLAPAQYASPEEWAAYYGQQKAYQVLAIKNRWKPSWRAFDEAGVLPSSFMVNPPPTKRTALQPFYVSGALGSIEQSHSGERAAFHAMVDGSTILAVTLSSSERQVEPLHLDLTKTPLTEKEFDSSSVGQRLRAWRMPLKKQPKGAWNEPYNQEKISEAGYRDDRVTATDELEEVFEQTKIPIVSDATRLAELPVKTTSAPTLTEWLQAFRQEQNGYAKIMNGIFVFRHRAFWRIRKYDIAENNLLWLEERSKFGKPSLDDLASFAYAAATPASLIKLWMPLVETDDYLVRFDRTPFRKSLPALIAYGGFSEDERLALKTPGVLYNWTKKNPHFNVRGQILGYSGTDWVVSQAAYYAPFFETSMDDMAQLAYMCWWHIPIPVTVPMLPDIGLTEPELRPAANCPAINLALEPTFGGSAPDSLWVGIDPYAHSRYSLNFGSP